jgi:hypothetical protein
MSGFVFPPGLNLLERKTKEIVSGGKEAAKADFLKIISENIVKIMNSLLLKENLCLTLGCKPTTPLCRFLSVFVGRFCRFLNLQKPTDLFFGTDNFIGFCRFLSVFLSVSGPHFMVFTQVFRKKFTPRVSFCSVK